MGRSTDEERCGQSSFAYELFAVGNRNTLLREMNAGSTNGASNVEPVVHENAAWSGREAKGFLNHVSECPARQVFLANLNPIHARRRRCLHFLKKQRVRFDSRRE